MRAFSVCEGMVQKAARRTCTGWHSACFLIFERASQLPATGRTRARGGCTGVTYAFGQSGVEGDSLQGDLSDGVRSRIGILHTTFACYGLRVTSGKPSRLPQGHQPCTLTIRAQFPVTLPGLTRHALTRKIKSFLQPTTMSPTCSWPTSGNSPDGSRDITLSPPLLYIVHKSGAISSCCLVT